MQRNFMNVNEVFPILDLINRKLNQGKGTPYHLESPLFSDGTGSGGSFDTSQWQVESFEVVRDTENPIDPNVIKQVIIVYRNGAIDTITLTRGLNPPVDNTVPDAEYINNLMIVGVTITTELHGRTQEVVAQIFRENGYGKFQKVELTYSGTDLYDEGEPAQGEEDNTEYYENPNDFYDGESDQGYDTEADTAEDYAGTEYLPEDEIEPPEDGWADGYNPSNPVDIDIQVEVEMEEDYAEIGYSNFTDDELENPFEGIEDEV